MNNRMKQKVIVLLVAVLVLLLGLYSGMNQLLLKHNTVYNATIFPGYILKAKDIVDVDIVDSNGKNVKKDFKTKIEKQKDGKAIVTMTKKEGLNNFKGTIHYIQEDYSKLELIQNIFVNQYNDFANKINNWNYQRITGTNISKSYTKYPTIFSEADNKKIVPHNIGVLLIFVGIVLFLIGLVIIYHSDKEAFYIKLNINDREGD